VANEYYLAMLSRQTGGLLQGIAVWSYNTVGQGLYNDTHQTSYDPDTMFARVSESFPRLRQILAAPAGRAQVLILAPDAWAHRLLGTSHLIDPYRFRSYDFHRLAVFARNNLAAAVVGRLTGEELGDVTAVAVLAREPEAVSDDDVAQLQRYAAQGGSVIASRALSPRLGAQATYVDGARAEEAFADPPSSEHAALWRRVLGVEHPLAEGYLVVTPNDALLYTIGTVQQVELRLPFEGQGWLANPSGLRERQLAAPSGRLILGLERHHYAYLSR